MREGFSHVGVAHPALENILEAGHTLQSFAGDIKHKRSLFVADDGNSDFNGMNWGMERVEEGIEIGSDHEQKNHGCTKAVVVGGKVRAACVLVGGGRCGRLWVSGSSPFLALTFSYMCFILFLRFFFFEHLQLSLGYP